MKSLVRAFYIAFFAILVVFSSFAVSVSKQDAFAAKPSGSQSEVSPEVVQGAKDFIDSMGHDAINFLSDHSITEEQRVEDFRNLLEGSFDIKTIARFSLGTYWRDASAEQKKEYFKLFNEMIINVYSNRFSEYKGQKFEVRDASAHGKRDIIVSSYVVDPNNPEVKVDWMVRYKDGSYKVVDVIVEGISMSITQRSDFASIIQSGGGSVDVLLSNLKEQIGK